MQNKDTVMRFYTFSASIMNLGYKKSCRNFWEGYPGSFFSKFIPLQESIIKKVHQTMVTDSYRLDSTGSSQSQVPVKVKFQSSSSSRIHDESDLIDPTHRYKFQFPDPRRVRSHRSDSPVQFQSRSSYSQGQVPVPESTTSPIPSIRLKNISSSQGQVPVKVQFQFQFPGSKSVPDSAIRARSHRSDSVVLFSSRFQIPYRTEINCFS